MNTDPRPMHMDRIPPGTRVRFDYGKWSCGRAFHATEVVFDPEWATREWALTRIGTVITAAEYSPYPDTHPWGCPDFATPIRYDDGSKSWARTSCLDVIGWAQKQPEQAELQLGFEAAS